MADELQRDTETLLNTIPTGNQFFPELNEYQIPDRTNIDEDISREIRDLRFENRSLPVAGSSNTDLSVERIIDEAYSQERQNRPLPDSIRMPQLQLLEQSDEDTLRLGIFQAIQEALSEERRLKEELEKLKEQKRILMLRNRERNTELEKIKSKREGKGKGKGKGRTLQSDTLSGIGRKLNKSKGGYRSKKLSRKYSLKKKTKRIKKK